MLDDEYYSYSYQNQDSVGDDFQKWGEGAEELGSEPREIHDHIGKKFIVFLSIFCPCQT